MIGWPAVMTAASTPKHIPELTLTIFSQSALAGPATPSPAAKATSDTAMFFSTTVSPCLWLEKLSASAIAWLALLSSLFRAIEHHLRPRAIRRQLQKFLPCPAMPTLQRSALQLGGGPRKKQAGFCAATNVAKLEDKGMMLTIVIERAAE
jgi:hypothetical protein